MGNFYVRIHYHMISFVAITQRIIAFARATFTYTSVSARVPVIKFGSLMK